MYCSVPIMPLLRYVSVVISCHVELGHSVGSNAASFEVGPSAGFQCCS